MSDSYHECLDYLNAAPEERFPGASTLLRCAAELGPRAFEILVMQGERLLMGVQAYPSQDFEPERDYQQDLSEEALDAANYSCAAILHQKDPKIRAHLIEALEGALKQVHTAMAIRELARTRREQQPPRRDTERNMPAMVPTGDDAEIELA